MPLVPTWSGFTPPNITPSATPPTPFTPSGVTPSVVAPATFTPTGVTPSAALPGLFFPLVSFVGTNADLLLQPTLLVTPAASEVVFVVSPNTGGVVPTWSLFTLTAG